MMIPTQVYVVTSGDYSDYGINSIWLTLEEAQAAAASYASVEVWPIGENQRTLGDFWRHGDFDGTTGEPIYEQSEDGPVLTERRASVLCWDSNNKIGIRVNADTQERADKVYSEVRARVLAGISQGLPPEAIADSKYTNGTWRPC